VELGSLASAPNSVTQPSTTRMASSALCFPVCIPPASLAAAAPSSSGGHRHDAAPCRPKVGTPTAEAETTLHLPAERSPPGRGQLQTASPNPCCKSEATRTAPRGAAGTAAAQPNRLVLHYHHEMSDEDAPETPCCPRCQGPMTLIRTWPASFGFPECRSYRCIVCGRVETFEHASGTDTG
jgi:hypothetical protein